MKSISLFILLLACCALFAQEGALDPSFGQGGRLTISFDGSTPAHDPTVVTVQSDGKILVAGFGFHLPGVTKPHICALRLLPDGSLDPTFSGDGKAGFQIDASTTNNIPRAVRVLSNGKILMLVTASPKHYFLRLLPNGEADSTFGTNGVVKIFSTFESVSGQNFGYTMEVQTNGKIVLAHRANYSAPIATAAQIVSRFLSNGTPDNTFAGIGRLAIDSSSTLAPSTGPIENVKMALLTGNKILVAGDTVLVSSPNNAIVKLIRLNADGTFDQTFGPNGQLKLANTQLGVRDLQVDANQNIFLAGVQGGTNAVVKIKPNGALDTPYGTNGVATGGTNFNVNSEGSMVISHGNAVLSGISNAFQTLCKSFDSQGFLKTSFGIGGVTTVPQIGEENIVRSMAVQADGKVILIGKRKEVSGINISDFEVIRLNAATSAVQEVFEKNNFQIWPNPMSDVLNVSLSGISGGTALSLFSSDGRLLRSQPAREGAQEFDLKNLPAGNYLLQLNTPGKMPVASVVVKTDR